MRAQEATVLNFIGGFDKVFIIPPFQRNYDWTKDQCTELFNDIINAHKTNKNHYLGNIVYYNGKNSGASYHEYILVDGQQRITTILLLLCALRDTIKNTDNFDRINEKYLTNCTAGNRFRVRLKQTAHDSISFISIIDKKNVHDNNNNVTKNYNLFLKLISECDVDPNDIYETIPKLEVVGVNLEVDDDLRAVQTVFEKINSTGKTLTAADLIRNFLLLVDTSSEQERLYTDYWVKIEEQVSNNNISEFALAYLIMLGAGYVPEKETYKMFKMQFDDSSHAKEDILKDMYKYSEYYRWIKNQDSPNSKINRILKTLNYVKSDDLYPLYLYLFNSKYNSDISALIEILTLISDFMLRYRLVSPSQGGGTLRSVIQLLLKKLNLEERYNNYDSIHFELSNSATADGRFPTDDDLKESLSDVIHPYYAKIVLLKIEESETKNTPIPLDEVTVEHIMPQTLSKQWVNYLGGEDEANDTHYNCLNLIGNMAPISKSYNSKISNNLWVDKRPHIKNVQFAITSQIADHDEWKESDIRERNNDIAIRACRAIRAPQKRKRSLSENIYELESGIYSLSDIIPRSMSGVKLECIVYNNKNIPVSIWKNFLPEICRIAYEQDSDLFKKIVSKNEIHKTTSKKNFPQKDPMISKKEILLNDAHKINGTEYFAEGNISADRAIYYAQKLLELFGIIDKVQIIHAGKLT